MTCGSSSSMGWLKMGVLVNDDGCGRGAKGGAEPKVGCEDGNGVYALLQHKYPYETNKRERDDVLLTCSAGTLSSGNWSSNFSISSSPVTLTVGNDGGLPKSSNVNPPVPPIVEEAVYDAVGVTKSPSPSKEISGNADAALSKSMSPDVALTAEEGAVANSEPRSGKSVIVVNLQGESGCDYLHAYQHPRFARLIPIASKSPHYCTPYCSPRC